MSEADAEAPKKPRAVPRRKQAGPGAKVGKRIVVQLRGCARNRCQLLRKPGLAGVEVRAMPLRDTGSRMQVGAHALAKPQLAGRPAVRHRQARVQKRQPQAQRVELGVIAEGISNIDHVAGGPVRPAEALL